MQQPSRVVTYEPGGSTLQAFMDDSTSFVRGIMGPIGSGKSAVCSIEILRRAQEQALSPDGTRKSRWAVIRNSYPELKTTTIKTWNEWCPTSYGKFTQDSPIIHRIQIGELDMEVLFMALDRPEDVKKLLSLELTGAWLNEAREIQKEIVDALTGRVGRYPSRKDGGCTWSGIIMDTNPPDDQSWWYKFSEVETPKGWKFYKQPGGDEPDAENRQNLPADYYERITAGKDEDWIKVYVKAQYGFVTEGKPVYPMFRDRMHVAPTKIQPHPAYPLLLGVDFGLTPACVIGQKLYDGRWVIVDEFIASDCGNQRFAESLKSYIALRYPDFNVDIGFGDPAGNQRSSDTERTGFEILKAHTDWKWKPAPTNDVAMRREVVIGTLNRLIDGNPGLLVSPACEKLRKGFSGGYHFKVIKTGNGSTYHETPAKNDYSHIHDALQYLLLGGGEHNVVLGKEQRRKNPGEVRMARHIDYNFFDTGEI